MKLQKLQYFKIILAAIHLFFKIIINLKTLENSQTYFYFEVILFIKLLNVKLLLSNFSAEIILWTIMVEWKRLKLLYSSKGMCRIDSQLKKWYVWNISFLKHFIPFSLHSVGILWFYTYLTYFHLCFQVLTTTTFPFLAFQNSDLVILLERS